MTSFDLLTLNLTFKVKCHFGNRVILKAWPIAILSGMVASFEQKMPSKVFLSTFPGVGRPTIRCQASSRDCASMQSQLMGVGHLLLTAPLSDDLCDPTLSTDSFTLCLKLGCFQSTSTHSALEVSHLLSYINSRLTY